MTTPAQRLEALGVTLPEPVAPVANYVPFTRTIHDLVHISGQVSFDPVGGRRITGVVGVDLDLDQAREAARVCAINVIAQIGAACKGDFGRVMQVLKLTGYVQAGPEFFEIPQVLNGASDLMVDVFGDKGRHARSAVGVYRLPMNFAVEVDAVVWAL